jgi:hypothetical protein
MSLIAVHRALILSFVGLALLFGGKMALRYGATEAGVDLAGAIAAAVLAIAGLVYLARAPHLKRK